jgi:hypothetical protein
MTEIDVNAAGVGGGGTAPSSVSDIVQVLLTLPLTVDDRVSIVRALRDTLPELVPVDPRLASRIRVAQATSPEFIDSTVNGLENDVVWQRSASANPGELRKHRRFADEQRPLVDTLRAFVDLLEYNGRYQHFVGVDKARRAYRVGKAMSGEAGLAIQPYLAIIAQKRPPGGRKRKKARPPA